MAPNRGALSPLPVLSPHPVRPGSVGGWPNHHQRVRSGGSATSNTLSDINATLRRTGFMTGRCPEEDEDDEVEGGGEEEGRPSVVDEMLGSQSSVRITNATRRENNKQKAFMCKLPAISTRVLPELRTADAHTTQVRAEELERFEATIRDMRATLDHIRRGNYKGGALLGLINASISHDGQFASSTSMAAGGDPLMMQRPPLSPYGVEDGRTTASPSRRSPSRTHGGREGSFGDTARHHSSSTSRLRPRGGVGFVDVRAQLELKLRRCRKHLADFLSVVEKKRRVKLRHIREKAKRRPDLRAMAAELPTMSLEETVEALRSLVGSPGGNRLAAKVWYAEAVLELHRLVLEEDRRRGRTARRHMRTAEKHRLEDLLSKLEAKDRKHCRRAEREVEEVPIKRWLALLATVNQLQALKNAYLARKEHHRQEMLSMRAALVINKAFRRFRAKRGEIMLQRLFTPVHQVMVLRCRRFLRRKRVKAVTVLKSFLFELQKNKDTHGTLACTSKRTMAAVQHFRRATIHVQSIWRMQMSRARHYCQLLKVKFEQALDHMADMRASEVIDREVAMLAPENNRIAEINKKLRVNNRAPLPFKKPRERIAVFRQIREQLVVPLEVRDELIRGFVRQTMSYQGMLIYKFQQEYRAFVRDVKTKVRALSRKYAKFAAYSSLQIMKRSPKPPQPIVFHSEENATLLVAAGFKYMSDLSALWDPHNPSRDAQGRLVHELFPTPEAVGRSLARATYGMEVQEHDITIRMPEPSDSTTTSENERRVSTIDLMRSTLSQSIQLSVAYKQRSSLACTDDDVQVIQFVMPSGRDSMLMPADDLIGGSAPISPSSPLLPPIFDAAKTLPVYES